MPTKTLKQVDTLIDMSVRHVVLDFLLVEKNGISREPSNEEFKVLKGLYPNQVSIETHGPCLHARVTELPSRPWPISVAEFSERQMSVAVASVSWVLGFWVIAVNDYPAGLHLPHEICQIVSFYHAEPRDTLRPGLMIASADLLSTAGVMVQDIVGSRYVTVASHAFPEGQEIVYHPNSDGRIIDKIVRRFGSSGIALVELSPGISFENETFQSSQREEPIRLSKIGSAVNLRRADFLTMDNPFSGTMDAFYIGTKFHLVLVEAEDEHRWVKMNWLWPRQLDQALPVDGSCGSAMFDENGRVICFFRLLVAEGDGFDRGYAFAVAATELAGVGYILV
ncbi:hypothetical protein L228DRAFT_270768 [Xylona heveae TC161]|uniref:Uncharacterized protein n=1 Tax=Xylona heveae (strain CBS 132557 / TC161) TaxID=1328760 RepID=A0A165A688_XYLHT|nr:hypothetical protein L228DRAFT_270768 [Xylona heveae TC161]KZF20008.1 hypothetical protein L228DRAFT_270768 [Xylona heveae TC161]